MRQAKAVSGTPLNREKSVPETKPAASDAVRQAEGTTSPTTANPHDGSERRRQDAACGRTSSGRGNSRRRPTQQTDTEMGGGVQLVGFGQTVSFCGLET